MSHHEVSEKWHETNHTDPDGYFGEYGKNIDIFRKDVQNEINFLRGEYNAMDASTVSDWAKEAVNEVVEAGIMNGYGDGRFGGQDALSREQMAQVLVNMKEKGIISF